jgi:hypothetical protein
MGLGSGGGDVLGKKDATQLPLCQPVVFIGGVRSPPPSLRLERKAGMKRSITIERSKRGGSVTSKAARLKTPPRRRPVTLIMSVHLL